MTLVSACKVCGGSEVREAFATAAYRIVVCEQCSLARTEPPPGEIDYSERDFHSENNVSSSDVLPREWEACLQMQVELLVRHVPIGARVLEIGCGTGLLLRRLQDAGYKTTGVEVSKTASEKARETGLRVLTGSFPTPEDIGTFDAVVISHVVEHVSDFVEFLRSAVEHTACNFLLLIQTNHEGLAPRWLGSKWYAWVPSQHYWHFTPRSLAKLLRGMGFAPRECQFSCLAPLTRKHAVINALTRARSSWKDQFHLLFVRAGDRSPTDK